MTTIPAKCPSCQDQMVISQLTCTACNTAVAGYYPLSAFAHLSEENLKFLEDFVRYRGNVKEMERETGVSYWTIRTRLDKLISEMGLGTTPEDLGALWVGVETLVFLLFRSKRRGLFQLLADVIERVCRKLGRRNRPGK